jgi:hypothetical protein
MTDKHLATRAKLILRELHMRHATFLHTWMAEYVAECLETLEKDPTNTSVKDRCAATIARLWQAYVEDRRQSLTQAADAYRTRTRLTDDILAELRAELSTRRAKAKSRALASAVGLRHLMALEEQILEVYGASAALHESREEAAGAEELTSDALMMELLAELQKETETTAQRIVTAVFPNFAKIDLDDLAAIEGAAVAALRRINRARQQRLGHDTSSRSKKRGSTAKRKRKTSTRKPTSATSRTKKK